MPEHLYRGIYLCLGYPTLAESLRCLQTLKECQNVDFIELGLPFSDPIADGPTITAAAQAALRHAQQAGLRPQQMLDQVWQALDSCQTGASHRQDIYLMTYSNLVYHLLRHYGAEAFNQLPLRGLIIPDAPLSEQGFFYRLGLRQPLIPFATPESTAEDLARLGQNQTAPFVYFVAVRGITGGQTDFGSPQLQQQYAAVWGAAQTTEAAPSSEAVAPGAAAPRPVVLGFGVRGKGEVQQLAEFASGYVIGSAAVERQGDLRAYRDFLYSL